MMQPESEEDKSVRAPVRSVPTLAPGSVMSGSGAFEFAFVQLHTGLYATDIFMQ